MDGTMAAFGRGIDYAGDPGPRVCGDRQMTPEEKQRGEQHLHDLEKRRQETIQDLAELRSPTIQLPSPKWDFMEDGKPAKQSYLARKIESLTLQIELLEKTLKP